MEEGVNERLVEEYLAGDPQAVETIERWIRSIARPFRVRLGNEYEDLVQETHLVVYRQLLREKYRGEANLYTFTRILVLNRCIDWTTRRKVVEVSWDDPDGSEDPEERGPGWAPDAKNLVDRILENLEEPCRKLLPKFYLKELSYKEIAKQTGQKPGTVRVQVHRCLKHAYRIYKQLNWFPGRSGG